MSRELGEYVDAGFIEGGIYVNIGDMLQMWSGDVLIATVSFKLLVASLLWLLVKCFASRLILYNCLK